jgi:hypothetical protein
MELLPFLDEELELKLRNIDQLKAFEQAFTQHPNIKIHSGNLP